MSSLIGVNENEQLHTLHEMADLVDNMYFPSRTGKLVKKPFQIGISVSIYSTVDLFKELKSEGLSFLLTTRINQDSLENVFSTLRLMGGSNSHPSAIEVCNRIRKICVTKNLKTVLNNPSFEMSDTDQFVSADILDNIDVDLENNDVNDVDLSSVDDEFHEMEPEKSEARDYVAGYICNKLKLKSKSCSNSNSWISFKGKGKLKEPSDRLSDICQKCDILFDKFHGKGIRICHDPLGKLEEMVLKKHPDFPPKVVLLFCKVKFYSRIRQLNVKLKIKKHKNSIRSLKQMAQFLN